MKTTTNHAFKKPDGTEIVNIEDLNYNADKIDGLLVPATTTVNGLMTKEDKVKLNGVATGANNYTHPATHPSSMISGLHAVAKSGSYNDLLNKPTTFPPSTHTHTKSQITDLPTSLPANGGNADTLDGKHASDFLSSQGGTVGGALKWYAIGANSENGIEGGNGDSATFETCNLDFFSWNGIGFYPTAGGVWGDGKAGRSVVIDPRNGFVKAKGGFEVNGVNVMNEINSLKSAVSNPKVVKSVQRGFIATDKADYIDGYYSKDYTISAVNPSKTMINLYGHNNNSKSVCGRLMNDTTLRVFYISTDEGNYYVRDVSWEVIEFY